MKSDRYNNEGYADPTAYHAIESAEKIQRSHYA